MGRAVYLPSPAATDRAGRWLAPRVGPGDTILLEGPIGAGKTAFARALIQARLAGEGRHEDVPSPTWTLVQTYEAGGTAIWHADLYRLERAADTAELGLADAFEDALCLVEWPDRLGTHLPAHALTLRFETDGDGRRVTLEGRDPRWRCLSR